MTKRGVLNLISSFCSDEIRYYSLPCFPRDIEHVSSNEALGRAILMTFLTISVALIFNALPPFGLFIKILSMKYQPNSYYPWDLLQQGYQLVSGRAMEGQYLPAPGGNPVSDVELSLSGRGLRDMDVFSKSDPMVVVWQFNVMLQNWEHVGTTEVVKNELDPDFATKIVLEYRFEQQQMIKFVVYDVDTPNLQKYEEHDLIGECSIHLGQIVSNGRVKLTLASESSKNTGSLIVVAEELPINHDVVKLQFAASLRRRSCWPWLNPYLEAHKMDENNAHTLVYRSRTAHRTCHPIWDQFTIQVRHICGGDLDRSIRFRCLSVIGWGQPQILGETFLTLRQLSSNESQEFPLVDKETQNVAGYLRLKICVIEKIHSFLEYVLGGLQINCTIAIDFTASNGDPNTKESLHYISDSALNQYEQALMAVVPIVQDYNTKKLFPVFGFGAKIPPRGAVSHEFSLSSECRGATGVLTAYKKCIKQIQLFGPTNFSPIINKVATMARSQQDGSQYFILLIVTDGVITDMLQTKQAIISASVLPLSIIIIGVGGADFEAMSELDADDTPLSVHGQTAARDIVQFVPFRDFQRLQQQASARLYLAQEVLAEIPTQVVTYMRARGFVPRAAPSAPSLAECCSDDLPPAYTEL